jgi:hypothetical protein
MSTADPNRFLRVMPIVVGSLAGTVLLTNRLLTPMLTDSQARSDVTGVIISGILVLTGILWQRIQPVPPEAVELVGEQGFELAEDLSDRLKTELAWASHLLLTNTVTRSLVIYYGDRTLLRRGILGTQSTVKLGAIAQRAMETEKPIYLVSLKLYPGKVEFDYLPENTQGVICQPIGKKGVMFLGANSPRSYTKQDETWIAGIADKLANSLETC